jgi:DNA polymerase III subunit epsilon
LVNSSAQSLRLPEVDDAVREIVLDTETTGLNPAEGHRVLEIGAVEIVHQTLTGRIFHTLINPERDVPQDAARVHGHTAAVLKDKPVFASVVDEFLAFIGDSGLVIHNAEFDIRFVNAELARLGREPIGMDRVVDTLVLARRKHPGQPNSLDALCDRYRIDRSRRIRHGALLDAEILADIYCELTGGRQRSLALGDAGGLAGPVVVALFPRLGERPRRQLPIQREEASAHAQYIQSLGEHAIWFRYLVRAA